MQSNYNYHTMDSEDFTKIEKKNDNRISWEDLYFEIAKSVSKRSRDPRTQVGAVLVKNKCVIGIGYNGAPRNCEKNIRWDTNEKYKYVIHAELNAIANASNNNVAVAGSELYITLSPCLECIKLISQFQIRKVCFLEKYRDFKEVEEFANECGIKLIQKYKGEIK